MYVARLRRYEGITCAMSLISVGMEVAIRSPVGCNTDTRSSQKTVARVFFPYGAYASARQLANTLLGAKDGGYHADALRRQIRCCALATTISWFYELIDRQLAAEAVTQAQRRLVRRKLINTTARPDDVVLHLYAEQRISEPLSALASHWAP